MDIKEIIREKNRENFYEFYLSLGYDERTAAVLALYTYGNGRGRRLTMDELYEALCKGHGEMPPVRFTDQFGAGPVHTKAGSARPKMMQSNRSAGRRRSLFAQARKKSTSATAAYCPPPSHADLDCEESVEVCCAAPEPGPVLASFSMRSPMSGPFRDASMSMPVSVGPMEFATDEYEQIEEKNARGTACEPMSTFRMTTNTASAGVVLNQLRNGRWIDRSMVRIEEMLNYFRYDSKIPQDEMFAIYFELMDSSEDTKYLYINVQGREEVKDRQNITILLDVSGSMDPEAENTQAIIATILSKLGNGDKLSLVTYSSSDHVELDSVTINGPEDRIRVLEKLLSIEITGCTFGSAGIERAYKIGKKNYIKGGNNQVILITDGDLNFGITDKGGLEELIERKKKANLFLSVIGTGLTNYKDDKLEALCKHGNGVYRVVNNLMDVRKSIDEEYSSLVNIIAKDVKAQVEFNPEVVESYRLLGFENRTLSREEFTDDKVISEPFGSGGYGIAVYELKMKTDSAPADSGLKYSKIVTTGSKELGTVKIRYKEPLEDVSHELEKVIETPDASFTDNTRLAFVVYVCAEKLRGSDKITAKEIDLAKKLYQELGTELREKNAADLYKLAGILEKSEKELGIGIPDETFIW